MATLEQLGGRPVPAVDGGTTFLVRRCTELMAKDLDLFTVEDLRIMLSQELGVVHLLPRAVAILVEDPLAEGDLHPGDLLASVLRLPPERWHTCPAERAALVVRLRAENLTDTRLADAAAAFTAG